jgi:hypothetical protein
MGRVKRRDQHAVVTYPFLSCRFRILHAFI